MQLLKEMKFLKQLNHILASMILIIFYVGLRQTKDKRMSW